MSAFRILKKNSKKKPRAQMLTIVCKVEIDIVLGPNQVVLKIYQRKNLSRIILKINRKKSLSSLNLNNLVEMRMQWHQSARNQILSIINLRLLKTIMLKHRKSLQNLKFNLKMNINKMILIFLKKKNQLKLSVLEKKVSQNPPLPVLT